MTSLTSALDAFHHRLDALEAELAWLRALPMEPEPEPPERLAHGASRKSALLAQARAAGVLEEEAQKNPGKTGRRVSSPDTARQGKGITHT